METKTKIKNLPEEIYLQVGELTEDEVDFSRLSEVTWSGEKVFPNDVEYRLVHEEESVIKWKKGTPEKSGYYIVISKDGHVDVARWYLDSWFCAFEVYRWADIWNVAIYGEEETR